MAECPTKPMAPGSGFGHLGAQRILDVEKSAFIGKQNISGAPVAPPPPGFFDELFRALAVLGQQLASGENTVRSLRERSLGSWPENGARDDAENQFGQAGAALDAVANLTRIAERLNDHLHTLNDRL